MFQQCTIDSCKRTSRAVCLCCNQNICIVHLNEHHDALNSKSHPLIDAINILEERLQSIDIPKKAAYCHQKLEQWRLECHEKIDHFFEQKCQELNEFVGVKPKRQQNEISQVRKKLIKLIEDQQTTQRDIDLLTSSIRYLEGQMTNIEQTCFQIIIQPFVMNDHSIIFNQKYEEEFDLSIRYPLHKTMEYTPGSWFSLATNDQHLLFHQAPNLCLVNRDLILVKEVLWPHTIISNMYWSSTLNGFLVMTENQIYLIDERKMSIENLLTNPKENWLACACSDLYLFLSTNEWGSSILQYSLSLTIDLTKQWQSPKSCAIDECIESMVYHDETLALIIRSKSQGSIRIELRFSETFDCIWSLRLDAIHDLSMVFRCCSLTCGDWLVINCENRQLLQITKAGMLKTKIAYGRTPYRVTLFRKHFLVIATDSGLNFHKVKLDT